VQEEDGGKVPLVRVQAYVVLLRRQLELESRAMGAQSADGEAREPFLRRLKEDWSEKFSKFPVTRCVGGGEGRDWRRTCSYFVRLFLALLPEYLTKSEVEDLLLQPTRCQDDAHTLRVLAKRRGEAQPLPATRCHDNALTMTLVDRLRDPLTFLVLYDAARRSAGHDALWKVHSMTLESDGVRRTVLSYLCEEWESSPKDRPLSYLILSFDEFFFGDDEFFES
jgi:hypothetical protein